MALLLAVSSAIAQTNKWRDPSAHTQQFVDVEKDVRLEVLDWGGIGRPIVLLSGSGNTAHVYDEFAPKLTSLGHVYGITRRGFGASTHAESGYSEQRLAEDVLSVMQKLKICKPVLVGHSMSGEELTRIGDEHSDLVSGLVYISAITDPADRPASSKEYMEIAHKLPVEMRGGLPLTDADRRSPEAMADWLERRVHVRFPIEEIYAANVITPEGRIENFPNEGQIHQLIGEGAQKRDYSRISAPILAFVDGDCAAKVRSDVVCLPNQRVDYQPKNDDERQAIDAFWSATDVYIDRWMDAMRKARAKVRFIMLPRANHYVFLSNESDVIKELQTFVGGL